MKEDASSVCESRVEQRVASIMYRFASSSNLPLLPMGEIFKGVLYNVIQIRSLCANEPLNCIPLKGNVNPSLCLCTILILSVLIAMISTDKIVKLGKATRHIHITTTPAVQLLLEGNANIC